MSSIRRKQQVKRDKTVRLEFGQYAGSALSELPPGYRDLLIKLTASAEPGSKQWTLHQNLLISREIQQRNIVYNREWKAIKKHKRPLKPIFTVRHHT